MSCFLRLNTIIAESLRRIFDTGIKASLRVVYVSIC